MCASSSCVPLSTDYRKYGFRIVERGFVSLEESPDLHEVFLLENLTIHIVGHRKHFPWEKASAIGSPIVGYANKKNEIWLLGKIVEGKIVINQVVLGHELNHLLNFKNPKIADPDKLDDLGA